MLTKFTKSGLFKKSILMGTVFAGCMASVNLVNAQCYSQSYGTTEAGTWSTPNAIPYGPYNNCSNLDGKTTTTNYANNDHGFYTEYDGTSSQTWNRDLTGLNPNKTYELYYNIYPVNTDHKRHLTVNYNLAGYAAASYTSGINNGTPNQTIGTYTVTGKTNLHFTATFHGDGYQRCEQTQEVRLVIIVREVINTFVTPPRVGSGRFGNVYASNVCPASSINLTNELAAGNTTPPGFVLEWHTAGEEPSAANKVANPGSAPAGSYVAVYKKTSDNCYSSPSRTLVASVNPCRGVNPPASSGVVGTAMDQEQAFIMPNPVSGNNFTFVFVNNEIDNASLNIQMTDLNGRTVHTSVKNVTKGTNKIEMQTNGLAKGIYYLNYFNPEFKISGKLKVAVN